MKKILILCWGMLAFTMTAASSFSLYDLTCEQASMPLAIETMKPCFSWKIYSVERNFVQSAYQIAVASSPEALANGKCDIWDSDKTSSSQSVLVVYNGKEFKPFTRYYWKARIWDADGKASEWSEPQTFSTGAFSDKDWGAAKWIALEKDVKNEYMSMGMADIRGGLAKRQAPD
ncbi:MAG: alpha-L-rhamnosidase, partial [Tannerella sp.]|nr:alpha-L-rhamnosidase [Tannerella sp.]